MDEENDVIPRELPPGEGALQVPLGQMGPSSSRKCGLPIENGFKFSKEKWFLWENGPCSLEKTFS